MADLTPLRIVRIHAPSPPHAAISRRVNVLYAALVYDALATKRYMGSATDFSVTAASDSGSTAISAVERCLPTLPPRGADNVCEAPHGPWVTGPTAIRLLQGADRGAIRACGAGKQ